MLESCGPDVDFKLVDPDAERVIAADGFEERKFCELGNIIEKSAEAMNCADFPTDLCFDSAQWKLKENYIKIVKEEENTSIGGINPGMYFLQPLYNLILLSTCSHETLQDMHLSIPHFDKFHKIRIS